MIQFCTLLFVIILGTQEASGMMQNPSLFVAIEDFIKKHGKNACFITRKNAHITPLMYMELIIKQNGYSIESSWECFTDLIDPNSGKGPIKKLEA